MCAYVPLFLHLQGRAEVISQSSVSSSTSSPSPSPSERPTGPPTPPSTSTPTPTQTPPQPEIIAIDRDVASKSLIEWLRQNPGYSMDVPSFPHVIVFLFDNFITAYITTVYGSLTAAHLKKSSLLSSFNFVLSSHSPVWSKPVTGFRGASKAKEASL